MLPTALEKFQNNEHNKSFTKIMIKAILVLVFGVAPPSSAKREVMFKLLQDNIASQPTKIADAIKNPLKAPESVAAASSEAAKASWHNALWLYNLCRDFAADSGSTMTGVQIAMIALRELIWIRGQGYGEEWFKVDANWNLLLWRFNKAFKNFKNNMQFVGQLMERECKLAWDDNVNKENIERFEQ